MEAWRCEGCGNHRRLCDCVSKRKAHRCFDHYRAIGNNRWICDECGKIVSTDASEEP